jgi:hypothetical protein
MSMCNTMHATIHLFYVNVLAFCLRISLSVHVVERLDNAWKSEYFRSPAKMSSLGSYDSEKSDWVELGIRSKDNV